MSDAFRIRHEWEKAPGVQDALHAATWARFELRVDQGPLLRMWDMEVRSIRDGAYGSLLPLAEWIVRNWWNLLYEHRNPPLEHGIRELAFFPEHLPWLRRHCMLFAGEGQPLPDMRICALHDGVLVQWVSDPANVRFRTARFDGTGHVFCSRESVAAALSSTVEAVINRLRDLELEHPELEEAWETVRSARGSEKHTCRSLAQLGEDPDEVGEETERSLNRARRKVPGAAASELFAAATSVSIDEDVDWIVESSEAVRAAAHDSASLGGLRDAVQNGTTPELERVWDIGYQHARRVGQALGLGLAPIDLDHVISEKLGLGGAVSTIPVADRNVEAYGESNGAAVGLVLARDYEPPAKAFRVARWLHDMLWGADSHRTTLITRSTTARQAVGRAFAAELLAPAEALGQRLRGRADEDEVEMLAGEFGVSTYLIDRQIRNHRIAPVAGNLSHLPIWQP